MTSRIALKAVNITIINHIRHLEQTKTFNILLLNYVKYSSLHCTGFPSMKSCKNIVKPALHPVHDKIFDTLQTVCLGCDYYVTIECAQTSCAPLLQNAQYATEVRRFSAHTRNRCVMKITKYPDVLALQYWPLFYTYFAIDFSERAIPANIDRSILLTARMGRYGFKVALLRCLIRLII